MTMLTKEEIRKIQDSPIIKDNRRLTLMFDALGDPGRLRIFQMLMDYKDLCVTDVSKILDISLPAASQQLKIMEMAELIIRERMGQMICYKINSRNMVVQSIIHMLDKERKSAIKK